MFDARLLRVPFYTSAPFLAILSVVRTIKQTRTIGKVSSFHFNIPYVAHNGFSYCLYFGPTFEINFYCVSQVSCCCCYY